MFEQLAGIPAICVRSFRRFCRRPPEPFRSLFPDLSVNRWLNRWFIATNIYYPGDFAKTIYNYIIIQIIIIFSVTLWVYTPHYSFVVFSGTIK